MANVGDQLLQPEEGWQRIDDTDSNIKYIGEYWHTNTGSFYNGTTQYIQSGYSGKIKFNIYSSKIRIIGATNYDHTTNVNITIDGILYNYSNYTSSLIGNILVFEKTNLELKKHVIEIYNTDNKVFALDAIDIDEDGYIMPPPRELGERLTQPEEGWQRIELSLEDNRFGFYGTWYNNNDGRASGGKDVYTIHNNTSLIVCAKTTRLRLIGSKFDNKRSDNIIEIDNKNIEYFNEYDGSGMQILVYEITNLINDFHIFKIYNNNLNNEYNIELDCVDIDEDGYLITEERYNAYINSNFIKTSKNLISDDNYPLDSNLLELRDNYHGLNINDLSSKIKDIKEDFKIIKIKK